MKNKKSVLQDDIAYIYEGLKKELEILEGKKILITGGAGFLGYIIVNFLADFFTCINKKGCHLYVMDNFSRGRKRWLDYLNEEHNISVIEHNIINEIPKELPEFDYIIHAASIASPSFYRQFPIETIDANITGIRNILNYARDRANFKPLLGILYFSSSEVYGDPSPDNIPTLETYNGNVSFTGPRACYDESKRLGETLCINFYEQYKIPIKIVRPFNNYGPGLDINDRRLIPDIARNILKDEDVTIFSDGQATRSFCYVSDAAIGYIKALLIGKSGSPYNIGSDEIEVNVKDLAKQMIKIANNIFNYKGKIEFKKSTDKEYLTDNPSRRCPNLLKAKSELLYSPTIKLNLGLEKSMVWYKENF